MQTITSLQQSYLSYLQAQNSAINAYAPNTYWDIISGAEASSFLDLYYNLQIVTNSIYPQNAVGNQVDLWLYRLGLPARGGMTFGTIVAVVSSSTPVTIPINTVFTDSVTSNSYQTLQAFTVANGSSPITLYATVAGNNYIEPAGNSLTGGIYTIEVVSSTNGQLAESDQSCINRILIATQAPIAGARQTDYFVYAQQASSQVTWVIPIPSFVTTNGVGILGVFPLVGTLITEYQLNQGLLPATTFIGYSRQADTSVLTAVTNYIQSLKLVGLSVIVGNCLTYLATTSMSTLTVTVSLVSGYSLSTVLNVESQDINNNPITVQLTISQLVQREVRRAICNQNYGATLIGSQNTITLDSIIYELNIQLSAVNGQIAQVLTNIALSGSDIAVPNYNNSSVQVDYVYDITAYSNIIVALP
jgi:hypothetical protein